MFHFNKLISLHLNYNNKYKNLLNINSRIDYYILFFYLIHQIYS